MKFRISLIQICFLLAISQVNSSDFHSSIHEVHRSKISSFVRDLKALSPAITTISRASADFCQVRLDFVKFSIGEPDANGTCSEGFKATGHNDTNNVPYRLCGFNEGQHLYLNFENDNPITLLVLFDDSTDTDYWNFKLTQIACDDEESLAPSDCLQYYTESNGNVKSFNFQNVENASDPGVIPKTYQLSNLDYKICIRPSSSSYSKITYTKAVGSTNYYFVLSEAIGVFPLSVAGTVNAAILGSDCETESPSFDYVEIPNGQFKDATGNTATSSLFCGVGFPNAVTSTEKPFKLRAFTNDREHEKEGSVGFSLAYILT